MFFTILAIILLCVWFLFEVYGPRIKGGIGENFIADKLANLDPTHYLVLNDLLFPSSGNTPTTQIDHVVVSNYGIFCIETKNYEGWIFGNAHQESWTQVIYRSKHRFFNPIRQNYAHMKAIEAIVHPHFPNVPIYPYIAFPSADKLKISGAEYVGTGRDMMEKIQGMQRVVLSDADRNIIYQLLGTANITDENMRKAHISDARFVKHSR